MSDDGKDKNREKEKDKGRSSSNAPSGPSVPMSAKLALMWQEKKGMMIGAIVGIILAILGIIFVILWFTVFESGRKDSASYVASHALETVGGPYLHLRTHL